MDFVKNNKGVIIFYLLLVVITLVVVQNNTKSFDIEKNYIDKLKEDSHSIYIITGRDNGEYSDPYNMNKEWLDNNFIYYDKLILTNAYKNDKHGKTEKCLENNIDIMIFLAES